MAIWSIEQLKEEKDPFQAIIDKIHDSRHHKPAEVYSSMGEAMMHYFLQRELLQEQNDFQTSQISLTKDFQKSQLSKTSALVHGTWALVGVTLVLAVVTLATAIISWFR